MKDAEKELEQYSFCRCNNCYLVNLKYVECVERDDVNVGGVWLKISRPRKKEFLQALANYMGGIREEWWNIGIGYLIRYSLFWRVWYL